MNTQFKEFEISISIRFELLMPIKDISMEEKRYVNFQTVKLYIRRKMHYTYMNETAIVYDILGNHKKCNSIINK